MKTMTITKEETERRYTDSDGNECGLGVMCIREPAWAANRLRALQARIDELEAEVADMRKRAEKAEHERNVLDDAYASRAEAAPRRTPEVREPPISPFPSEVVERAYHEARRNPDGSVSDGVHAALVTVGDWLNKQSPYGEPVFPQHVIAEAYGRYRAKAGSKAGLYSALAVIADYLRSEEVRERVRDELNMSPREELETDPADAVLRAILP